MSQTDNATRRIRLLQERGIRKVELVLLESGVMRKKTVLVREKDYPKLRKAVLEGTPYQDEYQIFLNNSELLAGQIIGLQDLTAALELQ